LNKNKNKNWKGFKIHSSLRKYIGFRVEKLKVKDTSESFDKIDIVPTPKASQIWILI
jgi:hypothetical protein